MMMAWRGKLNMEIRINEIGTCSLAFRCYFVRCHFSKDCVDFERFEPEMCCGQGEGVAQLRHHSRVQQQELRCESVCIVLWLDLMDGFATPRAVVICVC